MLRLPPAAMAELTRAFAADLPLAWRRARDRHPDQTPYAFVLHGHEGSDRPRVWPVVLTDQGLEQVAHKYVDRGNYETLAEAREALRWSVPDGPDAYEWADGEMPAVDAAVAEYIGQGVGDATGYQMLADAAVPAWRDLDAAGTFGLGIERDRLLLGFMLFDVAKDDTLGTVPLLNPSAVVDRYRSQTEPAGFFQSANHLARSDDGRSLYTVGSTHDPAARPPGSDDESTHELVAYAVDGTLLTRRWAHRFQGFGVSLQAVVIDPADGSLVALRQRHADGVARGTLMRFGPGSPDPIATADFEGAANGRTLAVSPDGSRITVGVGAADDTDALRVFDRQFRPAHTIPSDGRVTAAAWIGPDRVFVGTGRDLRVIDLGTPTTFAALAIETDDIAIAADGSMAVVTRHPWRSLREKIKKTYPQVETPATVLRLPDLVTVGTVVLPGLILDAHAASSDGRTAIVYGRHIGSKRESLVAVDVTTGRELARRRPPLAARASILPDGRTVAIGMAGDDGRPPVEFWTLRDE